MKKIILSALIMCFIHANVLFAAPVISTTVGSFLDGETVIITGTGFGLPASSREFLKTNIDSGTNGNPFFKSGWDNTNDTGTSRAAKYTNATSHSGNNSLHFQFFGNGVDPNHFLSYISHDNGGAVPHGATMFASFWVRPNFIDTGTDGMQWKMMRWRPTSDQAGDASQTTWATSLYFDTVLGDWFFSSNGFRVTLTPTVISACSGYLKLEDFPPNNAWSKIDIQVTKNSEIGVSDGSYKYWVNQQLVLDESTCLTHNADSSDWFWTIFGYELSNAGTDPYEVNIYKDDIYTANSPARWAIGDNILWDSCTYNDIQTTTTQTDTTAEIVVNQGAIPNGSAVYLFAIDSNGVPSAGYPVTIGGTPTTPTATAGTQVNGCSLN